MLLQWKFKTSSILSRRAIRTPPPGENPQRLTLPTTSFHLTFEAKATEASITSSRLFFHVHSASLLRVRCHA